MIRPSAVALCLVGGLALAPAQDAFEQMFKERAAVVVPALEELAAAAQKARLFRECIRAYELIILLDPDHEQARRYLRYTRTKKGAPWERKQPFREPKNLDTAGLEAHQLARRQAVRPFVDPVLAAVSSAGGEISDARKEEVLRTLIRLDPEHAGVRASLGEVRDGDRWLPEDTLLATERRKELVGMAKALLAEVPPPAAATLDEVERGLGISFEATLETPQVRLLSRYGSSESLACIRACHIVPTMFHRVIGKSVDLPPGYTVYLLRPDGDKERFLEKYPGMTEEQRKWFAQLAGAWVHDSTRIADWVSHDAGRQDFAVRQTCALLFARGFGLSLRQGFVWEGFGLYLTHLVCGTRLTYFVRPSPYQVSGKEGLRERLSKANADWFREGVALIDGPRKPALAHILHADGVDMSDEDMLYAYILAAWLLESRPKIVPELLTRVGSGVQDAATALQELTGLGLDAIEDRLLRWLRAVVEM